MNDLSCDICGFELRRGRDVRYEVTIEVKAAYDKLEVVSEDLQVDFRAEIAKILKQLEGLPAVEAQDQIYRKFQFYLCARCQKQYIENPLFR